MRIYRISHDLFVWNSDHYSKINKGAFYVVSCFENLFPILVEGEKTRMDPRGLLINFKSSFEEIKSPKELSEVLGVIKENIISIPSKLSLDESFI